MAVEIDIWRTAKVVIGQHGTDASLFAAQRADALLEAGHLEGAETWRRVNAAIEEHRNVTAPTRYNA